MTHPEYILTLSCLDQRGIVLRVSGFLAKHGCNIIDSDQFGDPESKLFFMRVHFQQVGGDPGLEALRVSFGALAEPPRALPAARDSARLPRARTAPSRSPTTSAIR